jgi:hypothetical protein
MSRGILVRVAVVALPPILLWLWLLFPGLQPERQRLVGAIASADACLAWCRPVVSIGGTSVSCQADFLGLPSACPPELLQPGIGSASFFYMPSLAAALGLAPASGVLLELERGGALVFRRSFRSQILASLYASWGFHVLYWPLVALVIWRWPNSRFARRATWQPSQP